MQRIVIPLYDHTTLDEIRFIMADIQESLGVDGAYFEAHNGDKFNAEVGEWSIELKPKA
jgi:hypothetical protein